MSHKREVEKERERETNVLLCIEFIVSFPLLCFTFIANLYYKTVLFYLLLIFSFFLLLFQNVCRKLRGFRLFCFFLLTSLLLLFFSQCITQFRFSFVYWASYTKRWQQISLFRGKPTNKKTHTQPKKLFSPRFQQWVFVSCYCFVASLCVGVVAMFAISSIVVPGKIKTRLWACPPLMRSSHCWLLLGMDIFSNCVLIKLRLFFPPKRSINAFLFHT